MFCCSSIRGFIEKFLFKVYILQKYDIFLIQANNHAKLSQEKAERHCCFVVFIPAVGNEVHLRRVQAHHVGTFLKVFTDQKQKMLREDDVFLQKSCLCATFSLSLQRVINKTADYGHIIQKE
jgi:hypothetical protein